MNKFIEVIDLNTEQRSLLNINNINVVEELNPEYSKIYTNNQTVETNESYETIKGKIETVEK